MSVANVPSFLYARDVAIDLPGVGAVYIDVAFGGNFFALARARDLGFAVHPGHRTSLIELGLAVRRAANAAVAVRHPSESHIGSIELPEISEGPDPAHRLVRNAVVFGDGQLDRCPCGTGTSAAMAARHARGELPWASPSTARGSSGPGSEADSSGRSGWATSSRSSPS